MHAVDRERVERDYGDLIIAPKLCIEYVIVHELCHRKEHNHGPGFYRLLQTLLPELGTAS